MNTQLSEAIRLRESGDKEGSRRLLLEMVLLHPNDPVTLYQCAWTHDSLGREREAVGFYRRAIDGGLTGEDLAGAYLGLGSTLRGLGEYAEAVEVLQKGVSAFPEKKSLQVFFAMALYHVSRSKESVSRLLILLADTTSDKDISAFKRAIHFYAADLDRIWES